MFVFMEYSVYTVTMWILSKSEVSDGPLFASAISVQVLPHCWRCSWWSFLCPCHSSRSACNWRSKHSTRTSCLFHCPLVHSWNCQTTNCVTHHMNIMSVSLTSGIQLKLSNHKLCYTSHENHVCFTALWHTAETVKQQKLCYTSHENHVYFTALWYTAETVKQKWWTHPMKIMSVSPLSGMQLKVPNTKQCYKPAHAFHGLRLMFMCCLKTHTKICLLPTCKPYESGDKTSETTTVQDQLNLQKWNKPSLPMWAKQATTHVQTILCTKSVPNKLNQLLC